MLWSCVLCTFMGMAIYKAHLMENEFSAMVTSLIRVFANFAVVCFLPKVDSVFRYRRHTILWLWGGFGSVTALTFFSAVPRIGMGEASFLQASSGMFVALLAPRVAGQRSSWGAWVAIFGCMLGAGLMSYDSLATGGGWGKALALISGLSSALAYLMVARGGEAFPPRVLMFYWFLVAVVVHILLSVALGLVIPVRVEVWALLVFAGFCAATSQYTAIRSYQWAPAAIAAVLGYLTPVMSLIVDATIFALFPTKHSLSGATLILVSCLWGTLMKLPTSSLNGEAAS